MGRREGEHVALALLDMAILRVAEATSRTDDRVQDCLAAGWRRRDDSQDLGHRRLLLQGLGAFRS